MMESRKRGNDLGMFVIPSKWKRIAETLTCKVCLSYFTLPIRTCVNGHDVCSQCFERLKRERVTNCAECRDVEGYKTLSRSLDKFVEVFAIGCKYQCQSILTLENVEAHYQTCEKRPIDCSFGCGKSLNWRDIISHFRNCHGMKEMKKNSFTTSSKLSQEPPSELVSTSIFFLEVDDEEVIVCQDLSSSGITLYAISLNKPASPLHAEFVVRGTNKYCMTTCVTEIGTLRIDPVYKNVAHVSADTIIGYCDPAMQQSWTVQVGIINHESRSD